jgi:hypothetical protein
VGSVKGSMEGSVEASVQDWSPLSGAKWPVRTLLGGSVASADSLGVVLCFGVDRVACGISSLTGSHRGSGCPVIMITVRRTFASSCVGLSWTRDAAVSPEPTGASVQHPGATPVRYGSVAYRAARTVPSSGLPRGPATLATVPFRWAVCGVWAGVAGPRRVGRCGER